MSMLDRRPSTTGLAAAIAGIVTLSLVTAPPNVDVAYPRVEVRPVQLAAMTATEIRAAALNTLAKVASAVTPVGAPMPAATTSSQSPNAHAAASIQQAPSAALATSSVSTSTTTVTSTGLRLLTAIAALPNVAILRVPVRVVWYIAFPITIPLTLLAIDNANPPVSVEPMFNFLYVPYYFNKGPFAVASLISPPASTAVSASAGARGIRALTPKTVAAPSFGLATVARRLRDTPAARVGQLSGKKLAAAVARTASGSSRHHRARTGSQ